MSPNAFPSPRYSNFSLRHPRSLREAFGPQADPCLFTDVRSDAPLDRLLGRLHGTALVLIVTLLASCCI